MTESLEVIAAFVDGERVDSAELAQALAAPEGREYLIDVLALRELVDDQTLPVSREIVRRETSRWPRLSIAAAVLVTVAVGGYMTGARQGRAPESIRQAQVAAPLASGPLPAPVPTQVIRLESGVNWREQIGGH